jgi:alpha-mannosidase
MSLRFQIDLEDVLLQECKRSADGSARIVRLFGASGEDRKASLSWTDKTPIRVWRSHLREQPLERLGTEVDVRAWELVTLRIQALETKAWLLEMSRHAAMFTLDLQPTAVGD